MLLTAGIGFPLLFIIAISSAVLSYFIQNADADPSTTKAVSSSTKKISWAIENRSAIKSAANRHAIASRILKDSTGIKFPAANHYACPPTSVEALRRRYGTRRNVWGEWTCGDTRRFYRQQLPRALQIDGFLGLSLCERARLASDARHALRLYSRERCHLPGRLLARLLDGVRHLQTFGYWSSSGMTWEEVLVKYEVQIRAALGPDASDDLVESYVYKKILDRACETNRDVDGLVLEYVKKTVSDVCNEECDDDSISCDCGFFVQVLRDISSQNEQSNSLLSEADLDSTLELRKREKDFIVSRLQRLSQSKVPKESDKKQGFDLTFLQDIKFDKITFTPGDVIISYMNSAGSLVHTAFSSKHFNLQFLDPTLLKSILQLPFGS